MAGIRSARGSTPGLSIRIENVRTVSVCDGCRLALYEEWQETEEGGTRRVSTVLFRDRDRAAEGVQWVHVHETWIEPPTERGR